MTKAEKDSLKAMIDSLKKEAERIYKSSEKMDGIGCYITVGEARGWEKAAAYIDGWIFGAIDE